MEIIVDPHEKQPPPSPSLATKSIESFAQTKS